MMRKWRFLNGLIPIIIGEVRQTIGFIRAGASVALPGNISPYHAIKNGLVMKVICIPHTFGLWFENPTEKKRRGLLLYQNATH